MPMSDAVPYLGEGSALACAVVWAFAVILFKRSGETVHPIGLNLFKSSLALVLTAPTMVLAGEVLARSAPVADYVLLLLSGALGIGLADTFFFMSFNSFLKIIIIKIHLTAFLLYLDTFIISLYYIHYSLYLDKSNLY